ncbi:(d)CMP kinase [Photobacterium jeanii]|nr:(d)CMP kinase [Photobacterium jeanii]
MQKINVVGTSGSGKSTFSQKLAKTLNYPYLEMDAIYWQPNWQESSDEEFMAALNSELAQPNWVLDGNYNRTISVKWAEVDTVIWIDYSFPRTVFQAVKRAIKRSLSGTELWAGTGNIETFQKCFFSRDSIILWTLSTFKSNRKRYQAMFADPQYQHINFIRLTSPKKAQGFINQHIQQQQQTA